MYAVTDERIGESSLTRLINEGFSPILMPPATYLQPAVSAHTDMLIFIGFDRLFCHRRYFESNRELIDKLCRISGKALALSDEPTGEKYPIDVLFNACIVGEKLICKINDWRMEAGGINLTNGLTGKVLNQPGPGSFSEDGLSFKIDFLPDLSPVPFYEVPIDKEYFIAGYDKRKDMKNFNYCYGEAFEYGYVQTVHTAQGSQWKTGVYFEEYLPSNNNQLHYTALSRFSNKCIYVKKDRKYR